MYRQSNKYSIQRRYYRLNDEYIVNKYIIQDDSPSTSHGTP